MLDSIKDDERSKKMRLQDPAKFLEKQISLVNCQIIVEEHPGYGLYFAVQPNKIHSSPKEATESKDDAFQEHHFRG